MKRLILAISIELVVIGGIAAIWFKLDQILQALT